MSHRNLLCETATLIFIVDLVVQVPILSAQKRPLNSQGTVAPRSSEGDSRAVDNSYRPYSLKRTLPGYSYPVTCLTFSPDGRLLASTSVYNAIILWDTATGTPQRALRGRDAVSSVAFSPDGRLLASGRADTIQLWDVSTGALKQTLTGHSDTVRCVAFGPDGHLLASGSSDKTIRLWDVATGTLKATLTGPGHEVYSIAFHPNSRLLASGSTPEVKIWDVTTGTLKKTLTTEDVVTVSSVAFSPNGQPGIARRNNGQALGRGDWEAFANSRRAH